MIEPNPRSRSSRSSPIPRPMAATPVKRIDTHAAVGVPRRRARAQGQARGALSVSRLFDARQAQGRLRGRARGQPAVRARDLSPRRADHARGRTDGSRSAATATPVEWAVEMRRFDENATLDHLADAGKIDATLADALGRAVAAAHAAAPRGRGRALDRRARDLYRRRTTRRSAQRPSCLPAPRRTHSPMRAAPRSRACVRCCASAGGAA